MREICEFDEKNEVEEVSYYGLAKIKIQENYIGPNIVKGEDNTFVDDYGNTYRKNYITKILIIEYTSKNNLRNRIYLKNFKEGNYGLWLERTPPYYIQEGNLLGRFERLKDSTDNVKGESKNEYLNDEERIINDFLWIQAGEKIVFPVEAEEFNEEENEQADEAVENDTKEDEKESEAESSEEEENEENEEKSNSNMPSPLSIPALKVSSPNGGKRDLIMKDTC